MASAASSAATATNGEREGHAPSPRRGPWLGDTSEHARREVRHVRHVERLPEHDEPLLELVHASHLCAQPFERARRPRLHGPLAHAEDLGRLALRQLEEVAAREDVAIPLVEAVHGVEERLAALVVESGRLRRRDRASGGI